MKKQKYLSGFTIVELLIVIVVIGILAAITIVAYNGVQQKARNAAQSSVLTQAAKSARIARITGDIYPMAAALPTGSGITLSISGDAEVGTFCITATGSRYDVRNIDQTGAISDGPCDGQSGGTTFCPESSVMAINGYYCTGTLGLTASLQGGATRLESSASGVPVNAPGAFVGRQTTRDNVGSNSISVSAGETYCLSGWVATNDSTVEHTIGLSITGPSLTTQWRGVGNASPSGGGWQKLSGCITIPANYTAAKFWTQNNGGNGTTANTAWYQTAITLTKQ